MKKQITFNDTFLSSEDTFLHSVKQITIQHIYTEDEYQKELFISLENLYQKIKKIRPIFIKKMQQAYNSYNKEAQKNKRNGYPEDFQTYKQNFDIENTLYNRIEDVLLTQKTQEIKNEDIKTKMSVTNILLLDILELVRDQGVEFELSSETIYALETDQINSDLYKYCFDSQKLDYRKEQSKYEKEFLEKKKQLDIREKNFRKKLNSKFKNVEDQVEGLREAIININVQINQHKEFAANLNSNIPTQQLDYSNYEETDSQNGEYLDDEEELELSNSFQPIEMNEVDLTFLENQKIKYQDKIEKLENSIKYQKGSLTEKISKNRSNIQTNLETLRKALINDCQKTENSISLIKSNQEKFFKNITKNTSTKTSWSEELNIPPKKSTSKHENFKDEEKKSCTIMKYDDNSKLKKKKTDLIFRSLQYLEAYGVLTKENDPYNKYNNYKLNLNRSQEHPINGAFDIKSVLPLLISYLKFNTGNSVKGFLEHLDKLIDFALKDPKKFSETSLLEWTILEAYSDHKKIQIVKKDNKLFKNIADFELSFNDDMYKVISFSDKRKRKDINLNDIAQITIEVKNSKKSVSQDYKSDDITSTHSSGFITHQEKFKKPDQGIQDVVLEVNISLSSFFDIKPLKNQKMYKTQTEIDQLFEKNAITERPKKMRKNKIYVTASDTIDAIMHNVKRCIPNVIILEPTSLKKKFNEIIRDTIKNSMSDSERKSLCEKEKEKDDTF